MDQFSPSQISFQSVSDEIAALLSDSCLIGIQKSCVRDPLHRCKESSAGLHGMVVHLAGHGQLLGLVNTAVSSSRTY